MYMTGAGASSDIVYLTAMFSHRSAGKPVLVADIGDGWLSVALVILNPAVTSEVVASLRAALPVETRSREQSAAAIIPLLETSITKLLTPSANAAALPTPEEIHAVVRSPWTRFRTARSEEVSPEPRTITKEIIAACTEKALTQPSELDRSNILEAGVLQVFLNGYPTDNPIGKKASTIAVVAFESDIDAAFRSSLVTVFGKALPGREPVFHSGMRALLSVMHEHFPDTQRFLLLDVGGSTTSCTIVRKDAITQHAVVSEGMGTIISRVAPAGLPEETLTLLRMLANDTCSSAACQSIKESLAKAEPELVRAYGDSFAALSATRRLPNAAMLSAPAEIAPWMQGFFSRIDFSPFTATTQPLVIETLTPDHLGKIGWKAGVMPDCGVAIAASAVHILAHGH